MEGDMRIWDQTTYGNMGGTWENFLESLNLKNCKSQAKGDGKDISKQRWAGNAKIQK